MIPLNVNHYPSSSIVDLIRIIGDLDKRWRNHSVNEPTRDVRDTIDRLLSWGNYGRLQAQSCFRPHCQNSAPISVGRNSLVIVSQASKDTRQQPSKR